MTRGRIQHVVQHYRAQLAAHEQQAEQSLETAYRHTLASIQPRLNALYDAMVNAMADGEKIPATWLYEASRLESLTKLIEAQINHFGQQAHLTVAQMQHMALQLGQQAAMDQLKTTVPGGVQWAFGVPSQDAIAAIVGATQDGSPLAALFAGFGREAAQKTSDALIAGVMAGDNPLKVASAIQDALGVSRSRALTISRTEMLRSYRDANLETYRANADVVEKWRWTASPSTRTCAMCLAMDGQEFDVGDPFESHVNCRCVPVPITKSWADILGPLGIDTSDLEETSLDIPPASDWFDAQSESVQRQILGPAKLAAYQNGDITLQDLVKRTSSADWGGGRQEKSLADAIGTNKAAKYYANAR